MKKSTFNILFLLAICITVLSSCTSNDDESNWSTFNGVSVTVTGNNLTGYKFYTDNDAILIPNAEGLAQVAWIKEVQRAFISFNLTENNKNITQLEPGKTYDIVLNTTPGMIQQIPTFIVAVDTLSEEYRTNGQDSIARKNKKILSFDKTYPFYIKNGYMNLNATFDYSPYKTVSFLLYYDDSKDAVEDQLSFNLFFNNNIDTPFSTITSILNMKMPEALYEKYMLMHPNENDSINVYLHAETGKGNEQLSCKMAIRDLLPPA